MCDVVTRVQLRRGVNMLLELEPVKDFLLHSLKHSLATLTTLTTLSHLELPPAAKADGVPLVGLGVSRVKVQGALPTTHRLLDEVPLDVPRPVLARQHRVQVLGLAQPPEEAGVVVVLLEAVCDELESELLLLLAALHQVVQPGEQLDQVSLLVAEAGAGYHGVLVHVRGREVVLITGVNTWHDSSCIELFLARIDKNITFC